MRPPKSVGSFFQVKDNIPNLLQSNLVYAVNCNDCTDSYCGKTERQVCRRLVEHGAPKCVLEPSSASALTQSLCGPLKKTKTKIDVTPYSNATNLRRSSPIANKNNLTTVSNLSLPDDYDSTSDRITVLAVYAPVYPSNGQKAQSAASVEFYKCLQEAMDKVSRRDMVLLMGDFNARVGLQQSQTAGDVIGKHTIDQQNENGQHLVDFCSLNNLIVTNTFFQHKPVHQASWMHPGNKRWRLLDYILVNRKFRTSVHDVRAHRGAAGFIGTDHHLFRAKVKIHLKSRTKNQQQKRLKLDYQKLHNDTLRDGFKRDIERKKNEVYDDEMTIDEKYSQFVEHVRELGTRYFQQENNAKKRKEWLTDEILDMIPIPAIDKAEETRQDTPPSLPEVVQAIRQMKSRKAPGKDDVTAELLKAGGMEIALWLHQIVVDAWINEEMVEDWTMAILIRLYKNKGDKRFYDNYRGISLLIVVSKIFSRIILNRIQGLLDKKLLDQQAGFRPNRSSVDQIFT
ncbi:unnamed protein product [Didymodactylos carnosus]|uniref:Reverse transcriptase n=1 Tax=Didymodactylos carnosus TaxID=1234261 RepID=A0A815YTI1_9BILA|nr:unnamed protein product [Didymodactylos carnosus]CAF4439863.1 unnamed protein product [Didymodactylos carnosus]